MATTQYNYQKELESIWNHAVQSYRNGQHDPAKMFHDEQLEFIAGLGVTPKEIYDFAEDFVDAGEPDFTTFAMIHDIRRSYFRDVQKGKRSENRITTEELPPRNAEAAGLAWLPRIIAKAKAKLRGHLSDDIMYSCGGDRAFLQKHDIHPAEFLRMVWAHVKDEASIVDWVKKRSQEARFEKADHLNQV